jgi:hypothetical protein
MSSIVFCLHVFLRFDHLREVVCATALEKMRFSFFGTQLKFRCLYGGLNLSSVRVTCVVKKYST